LKTLFTANILASTDKIKTCLRGSVG